MKKNKKPNEWLFNRHEIEYFEILIIFAS